MNKEQKVYSIWSEDQSSWFPQFATLSYEHAREVMEDYCKHLLSPNNRWIEDKLIYIVEAILE